MTNILVLLWLVSMVLLFWGIAHPRSLPRVLTRRELNRKEASLIFGAISIVLFILVGVTAPANASPSTSGTTASHSQSIQTSSPTPQPVVTTGQVTETQPIPFKTSRQTDAALSKGQTKTLQTGKDGISTLTYEVTYTDDKETGRQLLSQTTTTEPVDEIIADGTYVAPAPMPESAPTFAPQPTPAAVQTDCTNGTYINGDGNTVCSPETSSTVPAGATAQCNDGTYSFSQHRSGTCSHHGGVGQWLQ